VLACWAYGADAQQPAPSPTPALASDPVAVVQAFFDAINRGDADGAAALFTESPYYDGLNICQAPKPCTTREEIASGLSTGIVPYRPITVDLEQVDPTSVIARGQGELGRVNDAYFEGVPRSCGSTVQG